MNDKRARLLGWSIVGVYYLLGLAGLVLQSLAGVRYLDVGRPTLVIATILIGFWPILGAIIVSRHPNNRVGWIMSFTHLPWAVECFTGGYAAYSAAGLSSPLPGEALARLWIAAGGSLLPIFGFFLLILHFPDGMPYFTHSKQLIRIALVGVMVMLGVSPFNPVPLGIGDLTSPLSLPQERWVQLSPLLSFALGILLIANLIAVFSLMRRFRHTSWDERQQIKWLILPLAFFPVMVVQAAYLVLTGTFEGLIATIGYAAAVLTSVSVAVTTAVAILRHRLYEIDIIINRTLVYGLLTGALGLVYFTGAVLFEAIIGQLVGNVSQVSTVASTLVVIVLFQPLRTRIQDLIDQRFYRRKYDAALAIQQFNNNLQDEVDANFLIASLLGIVDEALQPSHISIWLRHPEASSSPQHIGEMSVRLVNDRLPIFGLAQE